uniref:Uncharacterized protein n=1 Tax=Meleagris gallopavo TaxID=9103 RepID=A0A803Y109_MELGA
VAEDHGLGNGDSTIDITESTELLISAIAQNVILLNSVQRLLLSLQLDNVWVRNNFLSKFPHRILKSGTNHGKIKGIHRCPRTPTKLILVTSNSYSVQMFKNHYVPVLYCTQGKSFSFAVCWWCFSLLTFIASDSICKLQLRVKLPHLFNHFSCLKCQLVCRGKAQALEGTEE